MQAFLRPLFLGTVPGAPALRPLYPGTVPSAPAVGTVPGEKITLCANRSLREGNSLYYRKPVSSAGLEPTTSGFGGLRSIQLSYEDLTNARSISEINSRNANESGQALCEASF